MKHKIILATLLFCLAGCSQRIEIPASKRDFSQITQETIQVPKTKTAVLLPLSGQTSFVGENFQNAALIAGLERPTETTEVLFYDTKGTQAGTIEAYRQAINESPDIFVGPVFASEVIALRQEDPSKPVLSFTSDSSVLGNGVYSLALLIPQQIERIVDYACSNGQYRFALIGSNDKTGDIIFKSFEKAIENCPTMQIVAQSFYDPNTTDLTTPVAKIAPPLIDARKKDLTEKEKELLKNPSAERLSFDALFVFEQGVKLEQLISILYYYDVTPQIVPFYGLATLRQANNEQLVGAYFADMPQGRNIAFKQKYKDAFEKEPLPIASFGYDAIALISFLSQQQALNEFMLTDTTGYQGINGRFRLNTDGTNDRLLEMFQIQSKNISVPIESAPMDFR